MTRPGCGSPSSTPWTSSTSLQARVQAYREAHPGEPVTWERLAAAKLLRGIPLDSSKTPFALDPATGAITVARESKLFPLPGQLQAPR